LHMLNHPCIPGIKLQSISTYSLSIIFFSLPSNSPLNSYTIINMIFGGVFRAFLFVSLRL
jgi:hypothetical protein